MNVPNRDNVKDVTEELLNPSDEPKNFVLGITEFKQVYESIYQKRGDTRIDIVLNGTWAMAQFSELVNHPIRILPDAEFGRFSWLPGRKRFLEKADFEIAHTSAIFYGQMRYLTFRRFLKEEFETNGINAITIFVLSVAMLFAATRNPAIAADVITSACDVLIGISAIFFSVFLLFTISQNLPLLDISYFSRGLTQRFIQVDRYVAWFAIAVLGITATSRTFAVLLPMPSSQSQTTAPMSTYLMYSLIFSTALSITLLAISFMTVVRYYFTRIQYIHETELSKTILRDAFTSSNNSQEKL